MFLINGFPLNKKDHPDHYKWYEERVKEIKSSGKEYYTFKVYPNEAIRIDEFGNKRSVTDRFKALPITSPFQYSDTDEGIFLNDEWSFVESLSSCRKLDSGALVPTKPTYFVKDKQKFSSKTDVNAIIFMLYLCGDRQVKEIDYREINRKKAEKEAILSEFKYLLYNNKSPLNPKVNGDGAILSLAREIGIEAGSDDIYTLISRIDATVSASEQNGHDGYAKFVNLASKYVKTEDNTTVDLAIDRGVLYYQDGIWKLKTRGGVDEILCRVPKLKEGVKESYIKDYLINDEDMLKEVEMALEVPSVILNKKTRPELVDEIMALDIGWKKGVLNTYKTERLQEIIDDKEKPKE